MGHTSWKSHGAFPMPPFDKKVVTTKGYFATDEPYFVGLRRASRGSGLGMGYCTHRFPWIKFLLL